MTRETPGRPRLRDRLRRRADEQEQRRQQRQQQEDREERRARESEERLHARLTSQVAAQWAELRAARETPEPVIHAGPSNLERAQVPYGVDLAASWAWRFLVISAATLAVLWTLRFFAVLVLPLLVAMLLAALVAPVVAGATRMGVPRKLASLLVVLLGLASVSLLLVFVGQQVADGIGDLSSQVVSGLEEIQKWLRDGPLKVSDSQLNELLANAQDWITQQGKDLGQHATEVGTTVSHVVAGFFIVLFATYFFLADGRLIWAWVVRLFPRNARLKADSSGLVAWRSLTQFVRATVLVAATDALGIAIWAAVLGLPFVSAIGVLVFLGAFIPMIGATISGTVAVLVALVAKGPVVALVMLGGVVVVQQIEAHILQPFLMGRFVSVHPLGVIVAIAAGVLVAGVAGALIAVPAAAALNAVIQHLASQTEVGQSLEEIAAQDPMEPDPEEPADAEDVADVDDPEDEATEATDRSDR